MQNKRNSSNANADGDFGEAPKQERVISLPRRLDSMTDNLKLKNEVFKNNWFLNSDFSALKLMSPTSNKS